MIGLCLQLHCSWSVLKYSQGAALPSAGPKTHFRAGTTWCEVRRDFIIVCFYITAHPTLYHSHTIGVFSYWSGVIPTLLHPI